MRRFGWLVLLVVVAVGCTSYKVSMTSSEMQYSVEYSSFHPDASLMSSLGTAINTLASGLSKQMLEQQSKPPVAPVPGPVTPAPVVPGPPEPVVPTPVPADAISVSSLHGSGFVWKPVSENESKLVVLTPASWAVSEARIGSEVLRFSGLTNPDRPTYRGSKPGTEYPLNAVLEVAGKRILIPDPARRYD